MPPLGPIKRQELIRYLRELRFEGPYEGGKHQYMIRSQVKLAIPNPHPGDISKDLLVRILRQGGINRDDWERL
jgi:hypothetical protein